MKSSEHPTLETGRTPPHHLHLSAERPYWSSSIAVHDQFTFHAFHLCVCDHTGGEKTFADISDPAGVKYLPRRPIEEQEITASPTASARAPGGPIVFQATSTPRRELSASSSTSMSDRPFEDDVQNVRTEDRPQGTENGQRCHRTELTSYHDRAASLLKMDLVPLKELGQFIGSTENGTEYQQLVSESFKGARINVHSTKEGQLAIARLGSSSDTVVRDLVEIVSDQAQVMTGLATALDHVLTLLPPMQRQLLAVRRKAEAHSRPPLPDGSRILASHLTKIWSVEERPPFKAMNLNDFMERWKAGPRNSESDQRVRATDFFRRYLQEACEPPDAIRVYSCRQSGNAGRNPHLKDLPEYIVEALIDLVRNPSMWWIKLGKTDEDRETAFNYRKRCRNAWYPEFRECIGRALGEVRQWTMVSDKLVPRQKRRRIFEELGNRSHDSQDNHDGLSEGISVASVEL